MHRKEGTLSMSVPSWKRRESTVMYLDNARELVVFTLRFMKKFPKSATFYLSTSIMESAKNVYKYCATANNRFPKTIEDFEYRKKYLYDALGELDSMDCNISIAIDAYSISTKDGESTCEIKSSDYSWGYWGELIYKERNYIRKVIESDNEKRKDIK